MPTKVAYITSKKKKASKVAQPTKKPAPRGVQILGGQAAKDRAMLALPAAVRSPMPKQGMSDVERHIRCWVAGYIYVGDGAILGVQDTVYFRTATPVSGTGTVISGIVPVAASDASVGSSFCADVDKHFARKRVLHTSLHLHSLIPSTSNSMEVVIAPVRGSYGALPAATASQGGGNAITLVGNAYNAVAAMAGAFSTASWGDIAKDITGFIAGGSGSKQNEFDLYNATANDNETVGQTSSTTVGVGFAVSGVSGSAGLRGFNTHAVVLTESVDLLDYIGGMTTSTVVGNPRVCPECYKLRPSFVRDGEKRRTLNTALQAMIADSAKRLQQSEAEEKSSQSVPTAAARTPAACAAAAPGQPLSGGWFRA